jgi:crossover junction endodeoxyribonuclease RusA
MTVHRFVVEGNPVPKARARSGKGHHYTPARTRAYETKVRISARHLPCLDGPVKVRCLFYREDAVPCDLDNLVKSVLDGINGHAFADDRQIVWLEALKAIDRENPRAEVEIETVEAA